MSDSWSSDDGGGAQAATPVPAEPSPAAAASPPTQSKSPTPAPAGTSDASAASGAGDAAKASPAAAAPAAANPNAPVVVAAATVQLFRYEGAKANPVGPVGATVMKFPSGQGALLLYDSQRRTLATAQLWHATAFQVQGQYVNFIDDAQKTRFSMLFGSAADMLSFMGHACVRMFASPVGEGAGSNPAVVLLAAGGGADKVKARDGVMMQYSVWDCGDGSQGLGTAEGGASGAAGDAGQALAVLTSRGEANSSDDGSHLLYVRSPKQGEEHGDGVGPMERLVGGHALGTRMLVAFSGKDDQSGIFSADAAPGVVLYDVEMAEMDKKGAKSKKMKKKFESRVRKGQRGRSKATKSRQAEKKKGEKAAEEAKAQEAQARLEAEEEAKRQAAAAEREKRRAVVGGVMQCVEELETLAVGTTKFGKSRSVKDVKQGMAAMYQNVNEAVADDMDMTGAQMKKATKKLMLETTAAVTEEISSQSRDEIESQLRSVLKTLTKEVDAVVDKLAAGGGPESQAKLKELEASLEEQKANNARLMDAVTNAAMQAGELEDSKEALVKEHAAAVAALKQENEMNTTMMEQMGEATKMWKDKAMEADDKMEALEARVKELGKEMADLTKVQGKNKITWIPDAAVSDCLKCRVKFGGFTWRHHCRYCGRVFCGKCASTKRTIPALGYTDAVRVCDSCNSILDSKAGNSASGGSQKRDNDGGESEYESYE